MSKLNNKRGSLITAAIILAIFLFVGIAEQVAPSSWDMLFTVLKKGAIYALVGVSMNLLNGFTGLFSLGQAGFMLLGAYTYGIFTIPVAGSCFASISTLTAVWCSSPCRFLLALILAGLVAAAFAFLIGLPVLRLKSDYLAIATLGFAEIVRAIFQWNVLGPITNGSNLLRKFPVFHSTIAYFLVVGICVAVILLLINSSYGRAFKAIREDEIAAEAMGINLSQHQDAGLLHLLLLCGHRRRPAGHVSDLRSGGDLQVCYDL